MTKTRTNLLLALLAAAVLGVAGSRAEPQAATPSLRGDPSHPDAAHWIRCELYFGIGLFESQDLHARELRWRDFLDREVTPRFPDGLTVIDAYGQWRSPGSPVPSRDVSKVLVVLCPDTPANRAAIDAIRAAYKALSHSRSVLLVVQPADISF